MESCSPGWAGELDLTGIDDEEIDKVVFATSPDQFYVSHQPSKMIDASL